MLDLARKRGRIRPRDLEPLGLPRVTLKRLARQGALTRIGRGLHASPDRPVSEHTALAEAARKHPRAVVSLLCSLRIVRFSGAALAEGVEEHLIDGVPVRVTNVARTVVDCFKFRNKIGLDVALEALREAWKGKRVSMDEPPGRAAWPTSCASSWSA